MHVHMGLMALKNNKENAIEQQLFLFYKPVFGGMKNICKYNLIYFWYITAI